MSLKTRMILAFSGLALLASVLGLYLSFSTTRRYFIEETRGSLMKLAGVVARSLDGEALRDLTILDHTLQPEQTARGTAYQAEKDKLRRFRSAVPEARILYVYRATDRPGVVELVVDSLELGQPLAIGPEPEKRYYDTVANGAPRMLDGLQKPAADDQLTTDDEGVWLSGYAPVYASDGKAIGAVGLDLPAQDIRERQNELLGLLVLSSGASLVIALLLGLYLARAIAQPIEELAEATHRLAGGDLRARVDVTRRDEIGRLAQDFNKMIGNLEAMADALRSYTTDALESHEEHMALQLQRVLLPLEDLVHAGVRVSAGLRPVAWGGGDVYQHFTFGSGAYLLLAYGHVRGSGLQACALMTLVQSRLALLVSDLVLRPGEILGELNRTLRGAASGVASMDYLCAVMDIQKHYLALGTAGEVGLFLLRPATGELERLEVEGDAPLGQGEATHYADFDFELQAGDRLIVCSGYAAAVKNAAGEPFGLPRLEETLRRHATLGASDLRQAVVAELVAWAGEERIEDDLTVLVAELGPAAAPEAP